MYTHEKAQLVSLNFLLFHHHTDPKTCQPFCCHIPTMRLKQKSKTGKDVGDIEEIEEEEDLGETEYESQ